MTWLNYAQLSPFRDSRVLGATAMASESQTIVLGEPAS